MLQYIVKRLVLFLPTLFVVSICVFGLSKCAPGDPVLQLYGEDAIMDERTYAEGAKELHIDKPNFYCTISSQAWPDTLHRVLYLPQREAMEELVGRFGNWSHIEAYFENINAFKTQLKQQESSTAITQFSTALARLRAKGKPVAIEASLKELAQLTESDDDFHRSALDLQTAFDDIKTNATPNAHYLPKLRWNGFDNQYHHWASGYLSADFGVSLSNKQPVVNKLKPALFWTLILNFIVLILVFGLSIPLGVRSAIKQGESFDKRTSLGLFMLYSLPTFWIATLLVIFLTTPEYAAWMDIFPSPGLGDLPSDASLWSRFVETSGHLILPVLCLTYPVLAFVTRQLRGSMIDVLGQDYIRTARAKGLSESTVIWKHAFKNSLFPIITMIAAVIPGMIGGSVVIESIFNIPGMGWTMINAISNNDWPTLFAIVMLGAVLTIIGLMVADVLYKWVDPRVKF